MSERQWARSVSTRQALLTAALEVFADRGYGGASVADIVSRSGISVGSLYHHFGGKAGLFLALHEEFSNAQESRAARAVATARAEGVTDPIVLFVEGARAFLEGCWERRAVARLFLENDGPHGFDLIRRRRWREWVRQNTRLLRVEPDSRAGHVLVLALTTVIGEAGREVSACETAAEAEEIITEVGRILIRLSA